MAFTLTAIIVSICLIDAYVIGHWSCNTDITLIKDKKTSFAIARVIAFIIAFALVALCWFLFTHRVFPQWLTGVGSQPSLAGTANKQDMGDRFIVLLMFPFLVAGVAMGVIYATKYILTYIECKHTGRKIGTISEHRRTDIFENSVLAITSKPGGGFGYAFDGLSYHQSHYDEQDLR